MWQRAVGQAWLGLGSGLSHGIGSARLGSIQSRPNVLDRTVEEQGRGAHRDTCRRRVAGGELRMRAAAGDPPC